MEDNTAAEPADKDIAAEPAATESPLAAEPAEEDTAAELAAPTDPPGTPPDSTATPNKRLTLLRGEDSDSLTLHIQSGNADLNISIIRPDGNDGESHKSKQTQTAYGELHTPATQEEHSTPEFLPMPMLTWATHGEYLHPTISFEHIWIRPSTDVYDDDPAAAMEEPRTFILLQLQCIYNMLDIYNRLFGEIPSRTHCSPVNSEDHPDPDQSRLPEEETIRINQCPIGSLLWIISIGRSDHQVAVMSMPYYRASPRRRGAIRYKTSLPDNTQLLPELQCDWSYSVHRVEKGSNPVDISLLLGKPVTTTPYGDVRPRQDLLSNRSVTAVLHPVDHIPTAWFFVKQATVETATHGPDLSTARTCVEQNIDLPNIPLCRPVRSLGAHCMLGGNKSLVDRPTLPEPELDKRQTISSFHRVQERTATGMLKFHHIYGETNSDDVSEEHWAYYDLWHARQPVLLPNGNTAKFPRRERFPPNGNFPCHTSIVGQLYAPMGSVKFSTIAGYMLQTWIEVVASVVPQARLTRPVNTIQSKRVPHGTQICGFKLDLRVQSGSKGVRFTGSGWFKGRRTWDVF